jgi:diguanylate cyclase (GGDEF)-like protein
MLRPHGKAGFHVPIEYSLLLIDVIELKELNTIHGRHAGDQALRHVVEQTRRTIRIGDILFRYRSDEFVVFLSGADANETRRISTTIRESIRSQPLDLGAQSVTLEITVIPFSLSSQGGSLTDAITAARSRNANAMPSEGFIH